MIKSVKLKRRNIRLAITTALFLGDACIVFTSIKLDNACNPSGMIDLYVHTCTYLHSVIKIKLPNCPAMSLSRRASCASMSSASFDSWVYSHFSDLFSSSNDAKQTKFQIEDYHDNKLLLCVTYRFVSAWGQDLYALYKIRTPGRRPCRWWVFGWALSSWWLHDWAVWSSHWRCAARPQDWWRSILAYCLPAAVPYRCVPSIPSLSLSKSDKILLNNSLSRMINCIPLREA